MSEVPFEEKKCPICGNEWIECGHSVDDTIDFGNTLRKQLEVANEALSHVRYDYADNKPDLDNSRHWFRQIAKNAQEEIERLGKGG